MTTTADHRVMGRGPARTLQAVGTVGDVEVSAIVRHGKASPVGPYPGCEIFGIQRASDGMWAWAFIDGPTYVVRHISTWCER